MTSIQDYKPHKWLRLYRIKSGFTIKEAANQSGISRSYYEKIENGHRGAPVWTAKKIAEALGFDWARFYEDSSPDAPTN